MSDDNTTTNDDAASVAELRNQVATLTARLVEVEASRSRPGMTRDEYERFTAQLDARPPIRWGQPRADAPPATLATPRIVWPTTLTGEPNPNSPGGRALLAAQKLADAQSRVGTVTLGNLQRERAEVVSELHWIENNLPAQDNPLFRSYLLRAGNVGSKAGELWRKEQLAPRRETLKRLDKWLALPADWRQSKTADEVLEASRRDAGGTNEAARELFMARMSSGEWQPPAVEVSDDDYLRARCVAECNGDTDKGRELWLKRKMNRGPSGLNAPSELTLRMAAQLAGQHTDVLRRAIRKGELPSTMKAGSYVVTSNDYVAYASSREWKATPLELNVLGARNTWPRS